MDTHCKLMEFDFRSQSCYARSSMGDDTGELLTVTRQKMKHKKIDYFPSLI